MNEKLNMVAIVSKPSAPQIETKDSSEFDSHIHHVSKWSA